jgi:hypothetical protein
MLQLSPASHCANAPYSYNVWEMMIIQLAGLSAQPYLFIKFNDKV